MRGGASYHSYEGPHGTSVEHGTAAVQGAAAGPGGAAAGGKAVSGTEVTGPKGDTYTHESSAGRGVAAGPEGAEAGRYGATGSTYHGAGGSTYAHGTAGYSTAHTALPTDAGYGMPAAGTGSAAHAGYHQTEAVSGNVYAAAGPPSAPLMAAPTCTVGVGTRPIPAPGRRPVGRPARRGAQAPGPRSEPRSAGTLPCSRLLTTTAATSPTRATRSTTAANRWPPPTSTTSRLPPWPRAPGARSQAGDWMPLGVFALVQKDESDPHYVVQMAVNKSGVVGGNYTDRVSETTVPIQGAVDMKNQRVAWTVGNNKRTVAETGLYNLTQDEAPVLIHMGNDKTQQWLLVRLKQPQP